jgi:hypothetical protein
MRQFTTTQYAAIVSTVAFLVSCGSLYVSKRSYDLSVARDERELRDKTPAIDIQIRPDGATTASATISIINRSDINIALLDITVERSFEIRELYLSSPQQSLDLLKTSLSLSPIGTMAPKGVGNLKARISGVTDGKDDRFTPGRELNFYVRIRFADEQDTILTNEFLEYELRTKVSNGYTRGVRHGRFNSYSG